jgi:hypothetical protein
MDPDLDSDPVPDADPDPAIFVSDLQNFNKNLFLLFFAYNFMEVHLHHFSKIMS